MYNSSPYCHQRLILAQAKIYPHMVSIFIPCAPIPIKQSASIANKAKRSAPDSHKKETSEERSIRRAIKTISDYALCNKFTLFATFTFAHNRTDIEEKRKQLSNWLKNQQKRNHKFQYLAVPEFHKDGKSLHFHVLLANYTGRLIPAINPKTFRPVKQHGRQIFSLAEYKLGFTNVKIIDDDDASRNKVACYITKYLTKEMPSFSGKKRYFCSKGLKKPRVLNNPGNWFERIKPDWQVQTDNGIIMRFNAGSHPLIDKLLGAKQ